LNDERIRLAHGGGGEMTSRLIREVIFEHLGASAAGDLEDSALLGGPELLEGPGRLAFTTDSYVVRPLFFPGADLGRLAVCGTVNDLAMRGARPLGLSLSLILEEGLKLGVLERVLESAREAAEEAPVQVVTGDTKVVEHGAADGMYITTSGVGAVGGGVDVSLSRARPGDEIVVSGPVGNHAIAVLACREGLSFETEVESDAAPLWGRVEALLSRVGGDLHALNDPTRGGLAASLHAIAAASAVRIEVRERSIPVEPPVAFAAELLGLDVLTLANEGRFVAALAPGTAEGALSVLEGRGARPAIIGRVEEGAGVSLVTAGGGRRVLELPYGEEAPRIC